MDQEIWWPVVGFENTHTVSNFGAVRRSDGSGVRSSIADRGRPKVGLRVERQLFTRLVGTLVAAAFIGPRPEGHGVYHNDGDVNNNRATNLRYDTHHGHLAYRRTHRMELAKRGEEHGSAKLQTADALRIAGDRRAQCVIAEEYGISPATVSKIRSGRKWAHVTGIVPRKPGKRTNLTEEQRSAVRNDSRSGSAIARAYGVSADQIYRIKREALSRTSRQA